MNYIFIKNLFLFYLFLRAQADGWKLRFFSLRESSIDLYLQIEIRKDPLGEINVMPGKANRTALHLVSPLLIPMKIPYMNADLCDR